MDRYWVGGTANWDATAGTKWATTSGGAGGASVPTQSDNVYFDANSGSGTVTLQTSTGNCLNLDFTGFTGTLAGNTNIVIVGGLTVSAAMTWTLATTLFLRAPSGTFNITTNGKSLPCQLNIGNTGTTSEYVLGDALTCTNTITVTYGTFTTNGYNVTASSLVSSNSNTRTINLGSSTVTLSIAGAALNLFTQTNLTFNAGTSSIVLTNNAGAIAVATGLTFYDVSWTSTAITTPSIQGANTFNNLSVAGRASAGIAALRIDANQTINGTLTLSAGTNATMRTFVRSNTIGATRTLTCANVASLQDIDFRDITIAGAAAPVSGTRLGDCKGNSGITFDAPKTVYWVFATSASNWETNNSGLGGWSDSVGGTRNLIYFPLAQDTAVFPSSGFISGGTLTIGASYNIGTIDMSARTSNTMTLATGTQTPTIYGNWINGTGTTLSGTGAMTFAGRGNQTITSAGKTFGQSFAINTPGGSVTLQDAFTGTNTGVNTINLFAGTFDANSYNVTVTTFGGAVTTARTAAIGSGTWTLSGSGTQVWNFGTSTNLTVTGTGTISLTSASAKTFAGGGISYSGITLDQGGAGTLTITGNNTFANITNTAIGRVQFTGGTTNIFTAFNLNGASGNLLQIGSTNTTQATLQKSSAWLMGANSTDAGNNTGLSFTAGGGIDYLSVSYINGTVVTPSATYSGNFFAFF